ncbi:hypothetical protein P7C73_g647, partial [Tremellales sp. Uapishka_1]
MFLEHEQITPPTTPEAWSLAFADSSSSSGVRKAPQPRTVFPPTPDFSPKTENHDLSQLSADIPELFLPAVRPHDDVSLPSRPKVGKLRIVIVTENFLPKVDGVTRTLARLLEHLEKEGHEAILLGPKTGMTHYASHPTVGTMGIPLLNYPGLKPILLFVGDGPARKEIENICSERGFDAVFMGMRIGAELGRCYASADIFAFPSFTETFGQVVLEAMASGLPVVGLDADGTRDLVTHSQTGLLMPFPPHADGQTWSTVCRSTTLPPFAHCRKDYAELLLQLVVHGKQRQSMSNRASTDGVEGFTWWDAMERCVDGYREAISIDQKNHNGTSAYPRWDITSTPTPILGLAVLGLASGFYLLGTLAK